MADRKSIVTLAMKEMRKHARDAPVVSSTDPFRVLISTLLSQRTRDENTAVATERLFSKYATPKAMLSAPLTEIEELIRPSGFYKVKAARIRRISQQLLDKFGGIVPRERESLMKLEGVGPKTAGCVQVYAFDDDALPVDTHVHRISNRLALVSTKTPEETEEELKKVVPRAHWKEINHLMVRFGQNVCLPRNPRCSVCGLRRVCAYYKSVPKAEKRR
jgi:endonuclease III